MVVASEARCGRVWSNVELKWRWWGQMRGREVGVTTSLHRVGAAEGDQARGEKWLTTVENTFIGYKAVKGEEEMRQCRWMGKMKMR
jgi:hypothetical protein